MTSKVQDKTQLEDNNDNEFTVLYPTTNTKRIQSLTSSVLNTGNKILDKTNSKNVIYSVTKWILSFILLLTVSVFSYTTFYSTLMPKEVHEVDVNFQFVPCEDKPGPCTFPNASIKLDPHKQRLNIGQPYRIGIILELPDSYVNQELGMFMTCLTMVDKNQEQIVRSCKSNMPEFRSNMLRGIETLTLSPMLMTGAVTQRQWLTITFMDDYVDTPNFSADTINIEIMSKFIQIYSTKLQVHPRLFGLKKMIYHHPWAAAVVGIMSSLIVNAFIILFIKFNLGSKLLQHRLHRKPDEEKKEN